MLVIGIGSFFALIITGIYFAVIGIMSKEKIEPRIEYITDNKIDSE